MRDGRPTVETPLAPDQMATIPWTETEIAGARVECSEALSSLTLNYEPLPPIKEGLCGAPSPILLKSVGSSPAVAIDPPATVTCTLAKALSDWLTETIQPQAMTTFNSAVTKVHAGSYACRNRNSAVNRSLSEHALANAIDISDFVLTSGEQIAVAETWHNDAASLPLPKPTRLSGTTFRAQRASVSSDASQKAFLRFVQDKACANFGTVLGPGADEAHKSHLHLDMKPRPQANFCQ